MKQRASPGQSGLILARSIWCLLALLAAGLVVMSIVTADGLVYRYMHLDVTCNDCARNLPLPEKLVMVQDTWFGAYAVYNNVLCIIFALSYLLVAGVLIWRKPGDRMALFAAFFLVLMSVTYCGQLPISSSFWLTFVSRSTYLGATGLFLFFYLFPTGRLVPWWSCFLAILAVCYGGCYILFPNSLLNPFEHAPQLAFSSESIILVGIVFVQVYRYRRISNPIRRRQTRWVVFGGCSAAILYLAQQMTRPFIFSFLPHLPALIFLDTMFFLALLLIPLSIGIAILRSGLWDIDIIIHRTLVYGILSACVVGLYVLVVGGLGTLLQGQGNVLISLLATGLIAVLFHPLRERLQRSVNYLVYGKRHNPYQVLSELSQRLEATLVPDAVLPTIVETLAHAFQLSYAAITLKQEERLTLGATCGQSGPGEHPLCVALSYQGELLGEMIVARDSTGEAFSQADQHLLEDLARHAGVAVHSLRLSADVRRAREQLILAREEERRRLRRDLHDGLGPQLASLVLLLTAVRKQLRNDPPAAESLLSGAITHAQEAITDIRRLVYDLRPPALDDLGLLGALQENMRGYAASEIAFTLVAPETLPPLPAAVEVACYRIAQEALTNVIYHAQAQHCILQLSINQALTLEVTDDGRGLPGGQKQGIGLTTMRERAYELGGTCTIDAPPQGGTRVFVRLPLQ